MCHVVILLRWTCVMTYTKRFARCSWESAVNKISTSRWASWHWQKDAGTCRLFWNWSEHVRSDGDQHRRKISREGWSQATNAYDIQGDYTLFKFDAFYPVTLNVCFASLSPRVATVVLAKEQFFWSTLRSCQLRLLSSSEWSSLHVKFDESSKLICFVLTCGLMT